jgi:hypothetical protein
MGFFLTDFFLTGFFLTGFFFVGVELDDSFLLAVWNDVALTAAVDADIRTSESSGVRMSRK